MTETEARAETAHPSMGQADQIAKEVMASETTASSGSCVVFEVPVEVPVGFLAPDGVMRVLDAPGLAHLPLEIELLPFLVARSGVALAEFLDWAVEAKGPAWVYHVVQHLPMDQESTEKYAALYRDEEAQRRLKTEMTRKLLRLLPEAGDEVRAEAEREGMREGKREGERMGVRHAIFALLSARGITLTEAQRAQIEAATEMPQLDAWLMAAVTATSADKVLAVTPPTTTDPH